jgi:hypothetical protein
MQGLSLREEGTGKGQSKYDKVPSDRDLKSPVYML